jgi:hypothetical protein
MEKQHGAASKPSSFMMRATSRASRSSNGVRTEPSASIRSVTSKIFSRGTRGRCFRKRGLKDSGRLIRPIS